MTEDEEKKQIKKEVDELTRIIEGTLAIFREQLKVLEK
jgi:hypothetical protein